MNSYSVTDNITGASYGTIHAASADEALARSQVLYGDNISVTRQYTTQVTDIDPLWLLLGLVVLFVLHESSRKKSK